VDCLIRLVCDNLRLRRLNEVSELIWCAEASMLLPSDLSPANQQVQFTAQVCFYLTGNG